jgi:hypothetical protein
MMKIIVIMATTRQQEQQNSLGIWLLNPRLCSSSWFCVLYSKSEMKIAVIVNRMYQNNLCSSLELSYIFLFLFPTYNLSFVKYLGFLFGFLTVEQYIRFLPFLCEKRDFPFSNRFWSHFVFVFVTLTPLSHLFLYFQHIIYSYFPLEFAVMYLATSLSFHVSSAIFEYIFLQWFQ